MKKVFALIVLLMTPLVVAGQDTDDQMKVYFADVTKRSELKQEFRVKDREELFMSLKDYVGGDETKEDALKLARELKVPFLYPYLKREMEGDHSAKIVDLMFATRSEKGVEALVSEYHKTESVEFRSMIHTALTTYGVDLDSIKVLKKQFDREDDLSRKAQLVEVLKFQLDLNKEVEAKQIDDNWKRYYKDYATRAAKFEVKGWDLMEYGEPTVSNTRPYGHGYQLEKGEMRFNLRHNHWQRKSLVIKAQIFLDKGTQAKIGFRPEQGTWVVATSDSKWYLEANKSHTIKRFDEEWVEVVFTITDQSEEGNPPSQLLSLTIGGNELFPNGGKLNGGLADLWIESVSGKVYIGKIEVE